MEITVLEKGAFSSALVSLQPGEQFVSDSGAMYRASSNIDISVATRAGGSGGLLGGLKRLVAGETFFFSTYTNSGSGSGEVGLAPTLQGELAVIPCDGASGWVCAGGSYLGSTRDLQINTRFQGLKGFFTGESISFLEVSGRGQLLVNAFGRIEPIDVMGELTVDTGHVVAFQETLQYSPGKAASGWVQSFLSGEGVVLRFSGRGRIYVQSHNPKEFGGTLGGLLPPRE